jgi:5-methylcytosine-specific restriction endonuclease McrA
MFDLEHEPTDEEMENDPIFWKMLFSFGRVIFARHETDRETWKRNYDRYIASNPWKIKSSEAKIKAGNKCQLCNSDGELHTHHRTYENLGGEKDGDLIVLCQNCHEKFHEKECI